MELYLTDKGRALQAQAEHFPACIVEASGQSTAELMALKQEVIALRSKLQQAL
ncbi:hypothetical protein D3C72_2590100 [compost metagenome]